ncbi:MAG: peptide-methionine (S)-S-oxide reductase MsrA [Thermoanaerobaculales bacterium]|jgi:methionine-S-sulfoxide reductase|nr:peptide-methionine (S)-S-oxide reductase MsrA [Thermoanaerobaculales bacterium]
MLDQRITNPARFLLATAALALLTVGAASPSGADVAAPEDTAFAETTETAILAGGCFWGMEDLLRELDGVLDTEVGYAADADTKFTTGAEAVRIVFDPTRISYEELLDFYFRIHNPTTKHRQGNDVGAEYRSAIFVLSDEQRATAERVRAEVDASGFWKKPLVTEINQAGPFKVAKEAHQDYLEKNPGGYTCHYYRE